MIYAQIETPAVLVDLNIVENNIKKFQAHCDKHGLRLRPHIKTHKLPMLAKQQLEAGAIGITCQKISEAEAMISHGEIDDVLITFNIVGSEKLKRLRAITERLNVCVVADNAATVEGLAEAFSDANKPLPVLVECDTGGARCGVITPQDAAELAEIIQKHSGLTFGGLMTYPPIGQEHEVQNWLVRAKELIEDKGIEVPVISNGGSPGMWQAQDVSVATEYRIGTYIYNDRSLKERGVCSWDDCALSILVTVVSVPTDDRAVIDAGSKVLTSDLLGLEGHGHVLGRSDIKVAGLSEEHGVLQAEAINLKVGDRLRIIPNHACVVSNMLDEVQLIRGNEVLGPIEVSARGQVW